MFEPLEDIKKLSNVVENQLSGERKIRNKMLSFDTMKTKATAFEKMNNDKVFEERKVSLKRHKVLSDKLSYGPQKWRLIHKK